MPPQGQTILTQKKTPTMAILWLIWAGSLVSLIVYLWICHYFHEQLRIPVEAPVIAIRTGFYCLVIILFPVIRGLKNRMIKPYSKTRRPGNPKISGFHRYLMGICLALALAEIIALLGLILLIIGDDIPTFYIFIGLSALAMLIHRPQAIELQALLDADKQH